MIDHMNGCINNLNLWNIYEYIYICMYIYIYIYMTRPAKILLVPLLLAPSMFVVTSSFPAALEAPGKFLVER